MAIRERLPAHTPKMLPLYTTIVTLLVVCVATSNLCLQIYQHNSLIVFVLFRILLRVSHALQAITVLKMEALNQILVVLESFL